MTDMLWELHIWEPAFSLPSIDPQCLAAVAYLSQVLPRDQWVLMASLDARRSPTQELPALRNGEVWVGGFRNIVEYVRRHSSGQWDLDTGLDERDRADCIAFSSFLEAQGQPLLDLSLYVSTRNYTAVTRAVCSTLQPFPLPYITPSYIRVAAKLRTAHLGLSSLDIDSNPIHESDNDQNVIPPSLRKPRVTVSKLLSQSPEDAAQIRLDALAKSFFEPLQSLRGEKRFFLSSPTSLDCIALGYLSLALLPDLPSPWLAKCMRTKFPQLVDFVLDLQKSFFGGPVTLGDAYLVSTSVSGGAEGEVERYRRERGKGVLPWSPPHRGGVVALGGLLISGLADSIPLLGLFRSATRIKSRLHSAVGDETEENNGKAIVSAQRKDYTATAATMALGAGVLLGYSFFYGLLGRIEWGRGGHEMKWHRQTRETSGSRKNEVGTSNHEVEDKAQEFTSAQDVLLSLGRQMDSRTRI